MPALFEPLMIKDITLRNRIGMGPMCQYSSSDGVATDWHMAHIGAVAMGGTGLIIAEATAVTPDGRITPGCAGLWNDAQVAAIAPVNAFAKSCGAVVGVQIGHAGRKASAARPWDGGTHLPDDNGGWPIVGPTDDVFDKDGTRLNKAPSAMSIADIHAMIASFVAAAKRSLDAGYELLEIHGAHGYLLHSFFTPLVNTRTDEYGGDFEGRSRFMRETVAAVREVWPERLPLAVRLSVTDWIEGGLTINDNIQMAAALRDLGVDMIDCSGGGATPAARASIGTRTADQVGMAAQLRRETGVITAAVGCITDAKQAEHIIASGQADIALMAREHMRDPHVALRMARELGVDPKPHLPQQYGFYMN
ncbi:MAG: NADH:flavin oxidoreductase/NADH oxidase [Yoonia sp.]|nr:NADH:flavin oxidoreductase/NADH oxidase [Yoonia sp.]